MGKSAGTIWLRIEAGFLRTWRAGTLVGSCPRFRSATSQDAGTSETCGPQGPGWEVGGGLCVNLWFFWSVCASHPKPGTPRRPKTTAHSPQARDHGPRKRGASDGELATRDGVRRVARPVRLFWRLSLLAWLSSARPVACWPSFQACLREARQGSVVEELEPPQQQQQKKKQTGPVCA